MVGLKMHDRGHACGFQSNTAEPGGTGTSGSCYTLEGVDVHGNQGWDAAIGSMLELDHAPAPVKTGRIQRSEGLFHLVAIVIEQVQEEAISFQADRDRLGCFVLSVAILPNVALPGARVRGETSILLDTLVKRTVDDEILRLGRRCGDEGRRDQCWAFRWVPREDARLIGFQPDRLVVAGELELPVFDGDGCQARASAQVGTRIVSPCIGVWPDGLLDRHSCGQVEQFLQEAKGHLGGECRLAVEQNHTGKLLVWQQEELAAKGTHHAMMANAA